METKTSYNIRETAWPQKTYIVQRGTIGFNKLPEFFGKSYGAIYGTIQKLGMQPTEPPCAIYYSLDEAKQQTDVAAAVPVKEPLPGVSGVEKVVLPPSRVITTTHFGSYESMKPAYETMEKYLDDHGLKKELIIEEYFSDPATEKDPAKQKTDIHFIIKQ